MSVRLLRIRGNFFPQNIPSQVIMKSFKSPRLLIQCEIINRSLRQIIFERNLYPGVGPIPESLLSINDIEYVAIWIFEPCYFQVAGNVKITLSRNVWNVVVFESVPFRQRERDIDSARTEL